MRAVPTGIGFATARILGREGAALAIASTTDRIHERSAELTEAGFEAGGFVADLTDRAQTRRTVDGILELFGRIDILVNNAGMVTVDTGGWEDREFLDMDDVAWDRDLEMNLGTAYNVTKAALPGMVERGWGRIVMVSSVTGPVATAIGSSGYAAAKAGMDGLMRGLAIEVARHGVTVNSVLPGWIATGSQTAAGEVAGRYTPMGRSGTPEEVGELIAFLASERASYLDGPTFRRRRREHDPGAERPVASSRRPVAMPGSRSRRVAVVVIAVVVAATCVNLGLWQLRRLDERRTLNAEILDRRSDGATHDRRHLGGAGLPSRTGGRSPAGTYDVRHEVLVYGRSLDGEAGQLRGDTARPRRRRGRPRGPGLGAVRDASRLPSAAAAPPVKRSGWGGSSRPMRATDGRARMRMGSIRVAGRGGHRLLPPVRRLPVPTPARRADAAAARIPPDPVPMPELSEGPHLSYAIQWFCFAAIAVVGAVILLRRERRSPTAVP